MPTKYTVNLKTSPNVDDTQYKLATFYAGTTCLYFSIIVSALVVTNYVYSIGKFTFYPVIGLIVVAECIKYLFGTVHVSYKQNSCGRFDERFTSGQRRKPTNKNKLKDVFRCVVIISMMLVVYFVIAILFGAEVFSKHEETFMFSSVLTALTIFPVCLHLGPQSVINLIFGEYPVGDFVGLLLLRNLHFTWLGAWLGAFVIPLDWDRPWQEWPIPCSTGAMIGYIVGNMLVLISLFPKLVKQVSKPNRKLK